MPGKVTNNDFIKHLKPRKNSKYHQGIIDPKKLTKYYASCKTEPVIYRSGLELQFINWCESNTNIKKWASEPIKIEYFNRLGGKVSNYYPDYIIEDKNGERSLIEVKPAEQTKKPSQISSQWLKEQWIKNVDKWTAAKKFAEKYNMKFVIVTEDFFK